MKAQGTFGLLWVMALLVMVGVSIMAVPAAWAQQTVVDFDNPAPPGKSGDLMQGPFQGINFGKHKWRWVGPDQPEQGFTTNHILFASKHGKQRTFTFKPAPRILQSLVVYIYVKGDLTLSDDQGQKVVLKRLQPGKHTVVTYWSMGSTRVKVKYTAGWHFDVDDIIHAPVGPPPPPVVACPCDYALFEQVLQTHNLAAEACYVRDETQYIASFWDNGVFVQATATVDNVNNTGCKITVGSTVLAQEQILTPEEINACNNDLLAIAASRGITCSSNPG